MSPAYDLASTSGLLADPVFADLAEEALRDYISWDELTRRPLPEGMSVQDVWDLLKTLRRFNATHFPLRDMHGREYWYTITRESMLCMDAIERYCHTDSAVHRAIVHRHGQRFLVGSRIREAVATCQLDDVDVSRKHMQGVILSGRAPRSASERLVMNVHSLLYELEDPGTEPFSPALVRGIYDRVVEGVDLEALDRHPARHSLFGRKEDELVPDETLEKVLERYCAYANHRLGDPSEPVAMKAHALINALPFWNPLPDFNGIVGRCLFRLYVVRQDYPVLALLPISSWYRAWTEHRVNTSIVRFRDIDTSRTIDDIEVDYTPDAITYLQLTVAALDELLSSIETTRRRDAEVRSELRHDVFLNYRQRTLIERALAEPTAEFRIKEHQNAHAVVYATARADLLDLEERGLFRRETRGKAFVFKARVELPGLLQGKR